MDIWEILEIPPTTDQREIRRAYAAQSKLHHAETDPEGFQQLYQAYQQALEYGKRNQGRQITIPTDQSRRIRRPLTIPAAIVKEKLEKSMVSDEGKTLVQDTSLIGEGGLDFSGIFQDWETQNREAYFSGGALHTFAALFSVKKICCSKGVWKEFFISEEFLNVQYDPKFIQYLVDFLNTQDVIEPDELPQPLCIELFIAYSLFYVQKQVVDRELIHPLIELMRKQKTLSSTLRKLSTKDFASRQEAFYRYNQLVGCCYRSSGQYHLQDWVEILKFTRSPYLSVEEGPSVPRPAEFFLLLAHLVRTYPLPEEICSYLYELYEMDHFERSSSKKQIQPLYDELVDFSNPKAKEIRKQKREEKEFSKSVFTKYYLLYEATLGRTNPILIKDFFSDPDFLKVQYHPWFVQKMKEFYKTYGTISPDLHQATLQAYQNGEGEAEELVEVLLHYKGKTKDWS